MLPVILRNDSTKVKAYLTSQKSIFKATDCSGATEKDGVNKSKSVSAANISTETH